jgi:predicted HAD superfamily Cof-like phosphohydrolase
MYRNDYITAVVDWNEERELLKYNPRLEYTMLAEELNEYLEAIVEGDEVAQADALGDIIFVAIGSLSKMTGSLLKTIEILQAIEIANRQKGKDTKSGKIVKPAKFIGPEKRIKEILDR